MDSLLNRITVLAVVMLTSVTGVMAQQTPAQMQAQMNAAGQQQSSAANPTAATPLAIYQQWYSALTSYNMQALLATYTPAAQQNELNGTTPSPQDYANMSTAMQQQGYSNYQLQSFTFTADPHRPKITILLAYQKGQLNLVEQVNLAIVDTATGWEIDSETDQQISPTPQ